MPVLNLSTAAILRDLLDYSRNSLPCPDIRGTRLFPPLPTVMDWLFFRRFCASCLFCEAVSLLMTNSGNSVLELTLVRGMWLTEVFVV